MITAARQGNAVQDHLRDRQAERAMMGRLFLLVYPLCLALCAVSRLSRLFGRPAGRPGLSIFAEARATAYAVVGGAFQA